MDFIMGLLVLMGCKDENYDLIIVNVDWLTKIVYYKPVKITINAPGLTKVIIHIVIRNHSLSNFIITDQGLLFTSKF